MALIGVLITTLIILLLIIFYNPFFAKTNISGASLQPKKIENSAQEVVGKSLDNKKQESDQIKNIDK
jgi:hypothetical protein